MNFRATDPCPKFCCQGSFPRHLPDISRKTCLSENSKQTVQKQCSCEQASQQEFFFGTKISVGNFSERLHTETSFKGIFPVGKLLCKSIVERQTSCAKLLPGSCRIIQILPGRSFLTRQSSHRKTKQKKTFTAQNETMLLQVPRSDMR